MSFDQLPSSASLKPKPFKAAVSDEDLDHFKQLLKLSKIGPKTFENLTTDVKDYRSWGISRQWLSDAKQHWETKYDWRKTEARINSFNNYTVSIEEEGFTFDMHFVALFSEKPDAVPLLLSHGWPGSFLEFLAVLDLLRTKYKPEDLPFHVIVPSLPGYGYSSGPPLDKDWTTEKMAAVLDKLMVGLGFGNGYIAQGGDIGSFISRVLGVTSDACKAVHLHLVIGQQGEVDGLSDAEKQGVQRINDFATLGNAYAREHGTRPATIGLVLSSSPIALLGWIGEKFQQWTDVTPPIDEILDGATLYWFTESFPRAIYPYRQFFGPEPTFFHLATRGIRKSLLQCLFLGSQKLAIFFGLVRTRKAGISQQ
ncbi:Putative epoxide hydrolase, alpha/Beta hydrolase [Septoria linicola]|uniref:Epoxide hydrolase, alpha/Beta hydrolase n=1 Tax=Septoria linicola TaxID=215465 RepID=A0A9Q9AXU8_9PEZI|nr:Putative epoxide hydrolase, alpha/Beta hydrolase [Septoria linicola]